MYNYQRLKTDKNFREKIEKRTQIIKLIREFFDLQQFLEVETPTVVKLPGMEPYLDPFKTEVVGVQGDKYPAYLITSPEYAMKKLLVGGLPKIYQICKTFRNKEDWQGTHNPEFTMIEWYRAFASYEEIIEDTIKLLQFICQKLFSKMEFTYQGQLINLEKPEILTMAQAWEQYAQLDFSNVFVYDKMKKIVAAKGYAVSDMDSLDDLFFKIFLNEIEPKLGKKTLTVLKEYPFFMAALSKAKKDNSQVAERFESYIFGLELCNGFSELTDADTQRQRLIAERKLRKQLGKDLYEVDLSFINALAEGMPESGGVALGVDRLVMLFTDSKNIEDVLLFPMKDLM